MEDNKCLKTSAMMKARKAIAELSMAKSVFTLATSGYCGIHWIIAHNVSAYMFSGALIFGVMVTMVVASLSTWARSSLAWSDAGSHAVRLFGHSDTKG